MRGLEVAKFLTWPLTALVIASIVALGAVEAARITGRSIEDAAEAFGRHLEAGLQAQLSAKGAGQEIIAEGLGRISAAIAGSKLVA